MNSARFFTYKINLLPLQYNCLIPSIIEAGKIALKYFHSLQNPTFISLKNDFSPVTQADIEINNLISLALNKIFKDAYILSEENEYKDNELAIAQEKVFIIDPIDGTKAFIKGNPNFTINLALKIKEELVLGIIYLPVGDILYYAEKSIGSYKITEASRINPLNNNFYSYSVKLPIFPATSEQYTIMGSINKEEEKEIKKKFANPQKRINFINISSSIKFGYLAEGLADIYYRASQIRLWDVAAGFAIANLAGLNIIDHQGKELLPSILERQYSNKLCNNQFRIEPFIIKKPDCSLQQIIK